MGEKVERKKQPVIRLCETHGNYQGEKSKETNLTKNQVVLDLGE